MSNKRSSSLTTRVLKSVGMLGTAQVVNIICSVIRTKFVAVWLGPVGVGLNALFNNSTSVMSTATQMGLQECAIRDISAATPDARALTIVLVRRWALLLGAAGTVIMALCSPALSFMTFGNYEYTADFVALSSIMFLNAYSAGEYAVMQGSERLKQFAKVNIAAGIAATAASIPLFYSLRIRAIVPVLIVYSLSAAVCAHLCRIRHHGQAPKVDSGQLWRLGRRFLSLGFCLTVSVLMSVVSQYVLSIYINRFGGSGDLGIYQAGYTLVNSYVGILFSAISLEYYPRLAKFVRRPSMTRTIVAHEISMTIWLITPLAVAFISASDLIVRLLYSSSFDGVTPYVTFAIVGAIFRGVSLCYAYNILAAGDGRTFMFTESLSMVVGLTLNIVAYHFWSYIGLGVSYIAWYAFYAALTAVVCRWRYGLHVPSSQFRLISFSVAVTFIAIIAKSFGGWWLPALAILPWLAPLSIKRILRK